MAIPIITEEQLKKAYEENEDFKTYVDKLSKTIHKSVDLTLKDEVVKEVYRMYFNVKGA